MENDNVPTFDRVEVKDTGLISYERFNRITVNYPYYGEPSVEVGGERVYIQGDITDLVQGTTKSAPTMESIPEIGFNGLPTGKEYSQIEVMLVINSLAHAVKNYEPVVYEATTKELSDRTFP